MLTQNLGYPRIGGQIQLKKAIENYWAGKIDQDELNETAHEIREENWQTQLDAGIDLIPCDDLSFYDQVPDNQFIFRCYPGNIFFCAVASKDNNELDLRLKTRGKRRA